MPALVLGPEPDHLRRAADCDEDGEAGFKELLWKLCDAKIDTRLGWSSKTHAARQPESLAKDEWRLLAGDLPN